MSSVRAPHRHALASTGAPRLSPLSSLSSRSNASPQFRLGRGSAEVPQGGYPQGVSAADGQRVAESGGDRVFAIQGRSFIDWFLRVEKHRETLRCRPASDELRQRGSASSIGPSAHRPARRPGLVAHSRHADSRRLNASVLAGRAGMRPAAPEARTTRPATCPAELGIPPPFRLRDTRRSCPWRPGPEAARRPTFEVRNQLRPTVFRCINS